jgi:hypothetical protein
MMAHTYSHWKHNQEHQNSVTRLLVRLPANLKRETSGEELELIQPQKNARFTFVAVRMINLSFYPGSFDPHEHFSGRAT